MSNQNNSYAAQMNSNQFKRHLLFWLIGLSLFNLFMLFMVILLLIFAPTLLRHCANWKSKSKIRRRQQLMKKHDLVEQPPQHTTHTPLPTVPPSSDELLRQLEAQNHLIMKLTQDLQGERELRKQNTFFPRSNIT